MRRLAPADLEVAARALLAAPKEDRIELAAEIVTHAIAADKYRKKMRCPHPDWGVGTIEGAARCFPLAEPRSYGDRERLACEMLMLGAILRELPEDIGMEDA